MARLQPEEQPRETARRSDIDARIMEQAEGQELQAMLDRMNSLLHNFYQTADVHMVNFRAAVQHNRDDQHAAAPRAAQGGTDEHED